MQTEDRGPWVRDKDVELASEAVGRTPCLYWLYPFPQSPAGNEGTFTWMLTLADGCDAGEEL